MDTQCVPLLPDFLKSPSGISISFYDRHKHFPARIEYGSIPSAYMARVPTSEPGAILGKCMANGLFEDKDGNFNQELNLPSEFMTLPDGERVAVYLTNLNNCVRGFTNLQTHEHASLEHIFAILSKLSNAIGCLMDNHLYLSEWDGHPFYFCVQFETFSLLMDGDALCEDFTPHSAEETNKALAGTLLYSLVGAFPAGEDDSPYGQWIHAPSAASIHFHPSDHSVHSDDEAAMSFWHTLPQVLRDAFESCFCDTDKPCIDAHRWAQLFAQLAQTVESECCIGCGKSILRGVMVCPHCQSNQDKCRLLSKWIITDTARRVTFGLALPVKMELDRTMISPVLPSGRFLRIGYHAKQNKLALQNISNESLTVIFDEVTTLDISPQTLFALKIGMQIKVSQTSDTTMTLIGFDSQNVWEVE